MRKSLRSGTGMDEVDAQRNYATGIDYDFKKERRMVNLNEMSEPPAKRKKVMITTRQSPSSKWLVSNCVNI